jgi:hypothetical protein
LHRFTGAMLYQAEIKDFRYDYVTGIFAMSNCLKVLLQFSFTGTFGPLLKMIQTMAGQLLVFMVVWIVIIILFGLFAQIVFYEVVPFT